MTDFFLKTNWRPDRWTIFAGALPYSKYSWIKKRVMKAIVAVAGGDTDTSRDYEYTDWNEVKEFVKGTKFKTPSEVIL